MDELAADPGITGEMRAIRDTCRRFAVEVLRPAGAKLDRMSAEQAVAKDSPLWDVLRRYKGLGFGGGASIHDPDLSPAQHALLHCIALEELTWGDLGLSITCALHQMMTTFAASFGRQDLAEFFGARDELGCLAITEPSHGSDHIAFTEPAYRDARIKPALKVRRDGGDFVLDGQKAAWVSCGTIAGSGAVFASFQDSPVGLADGAAFMMPLDLPGISRGKPLEKMGQRPLNQGEIFFDNVRVPRRFLVAEGPQAYPMVWEAIFTGANVHMGAQLVGVARAAYETALDYAKQWVQGGRPIIEHQAVRLRLLSMYQKVEVMRSHVRRMSIAAATAPGGLLPYAQAATVKVFATQTAFEVASEALQMLGGNGLTCEYQAEKLFRDTRAAMIEDGENYMLSLMAAARL
ncbi:MAG TPA: acyl-CoA dehydrogenase family protein [Rubrivivax sp.]|nr:acyl-CoA dehydrogenase family protein [Rubrivivax sp.]HPO18092.1 acyl-CoA dehydrogenase family protein [Rubrivivax sp.]